VKKHTKLIATRRLRALAPVALSEIRGGGIGTAPALDKPISTVPCVGSIVPCVTRGEPR
jgi:hypothetical protein